MLDHHHAIQLVGHFLPGELRINQAGNNYLKNFLPAITPTGPDGPDQIITRGIILHIGLASGTSLPTAMKNLNP